MQVKVKLNLDTLSDGSEVADVVISDGDGNSVTIHARDMDAALFMRDDILAAVDQFSLAAPQDAEAGAQ